VSISASKRGDWAVIRVRDQGAGVDPAIAEHIFAPLWSGGRHKNNAGVGLGLGLGLAVAHASITAQGGHISLEPASGPGATFSVELPLASQSADGASR
jgi:signal transduction histidine kinase